MIGLNIAMFYVILILGILITGQISMAGGIMLRNVFLVMSILIGVAIHAVAFQSFPFITVAAENASSSTFRTQSAVTDRFISAIGNPGGYSVLGAINEAYILSQFNEIPFVLSVTVSPSRLILGQPVIIDLQLSETITDWSTIISQLWPATSWYANRHLYIQWNPSDIWDGSLDLLAHLVDQSSIASEQRIPINLVVDDPVFPLVINSVFPDIVDEIYEGSTHNMGLIMSSVALHDTYTIESLTISINSSWDMSLLKNIQLERISGNISTVVGVTQSMLTHEWIFTPSIPVIVSSISCNLVLFFDLVAGIPLDNLQFSISHIRIKKTSGSRLLYEKECVVSSPLYSIVSMNKPIIAKLEVPAFVGKRQYLMPDLVIKNPLNQVLSFQVDVVDIGTCQKIYSSLIEKRDIMPLNLGQIDMTPVLTQLSFEHNHRYQLVFTAIGELRSKTVSSSVFLVDKTQPVKPPQLLIQPQQLQGQSLLDMTFDMVFNAAQSLDPESGITRYRVFEKSSRNPLWKIATEGAVLLSQNIQTVSLPKGEPDQYQFSVALMNGAGDWSDSSDVSVYSTDKTQELIPVLFNSPNPFANNLESTTFYYSLSKAAKGEMAIYSLFGYLIQKWSFSEVDRGSAGDHQWLWDGTNIVGAKVAKGVYIVILTAESSDGTRQTRKYKVAVTHE